MPAKRGYFTESRYVRRTVPDRNHYIVPRRNTVVIVEGYNSTIRVIDGHTDEIRIEADEIKASLPRFIVKRIRLNRIVFLEGCD
jgi:hypothetical protein